MGDILAIENTQKKMRVGGFGFQALEGFLFLDFPSTVGFTGCVHVLLQPFPFPPCFFDVYKPRQ